METQQGNHSNMFSIHPRLRRGFGLVFIILALWGFADAKAYPHSILGFTVLITIAAAGVLLLTRLWQVGQMLWVVGYGLSFIRTGLATGHHIPVVIGSLPLVFIMAFVACEAFRGLRRRLTRN